MVFNPEDKQDFGPHCRNCHKGSSRCATCHNDGGAVTTDLARASNNSYGFASTPTNASTYDMGITSQGVANTIGGATNLVVAAKFNVPGASNQTILLEGFFKKSREANWSNTWRDDAGATTQAQVDALCADDGFSWPHRTLGWKMLKDDLFGLDLNNNTWVGVGESRSNGAVAHDLDSVCLDCHNPTVWNATGPSHVDTTSTATDNDNDELLTRGLP